MKIIEMIIEMINRLFGREKVTETIEEEIEMNEELPEELENEPEERVIVLAREYHEKGTHGKVIFPSGEMFDTLELPWRDNQRKVSCIPEGTYSVDLRDSKVVQRTTGRKFMKGYEVQDVPDRTFIMFHPANYIKDLEGCIAPGVKGFQGDEPVVWSSREAFTKFMKLMKDEKIETIRIEG